GALALIALIKWRNKPVPTSVTHAAVLATAFVGGAMIYTGLLGGRIRHTEVRPGATAADAITIEPRRQRPPQQPGNYPKATREPGSNRAHLPARSTAPVER